MEGSNTTIMKDDLPFWTHTIWKGMTITCQDNVKSGKRYGGLFTNPLYVPHSIPTLCMFQLALILVVNTISSRLFKPLGLPVLAQFAGAIFIFGLLFPKEANPNAHLLLPEPLVYTLKTISYLGFALLTFMLGVETNMGVLRRIGKKSIIICFAGFGCSLAFSLYTAYIQTQMGIRPAGALRILVMIAQNFFGVTCVNVNDLGISNSELGRLASAIALILDIFGIVDTFLIFNLAFAIMGGNYWQPILVIGEYIFLFFILRPLLIHIVSFTPEGQKMKHSHFMAVMSVLLIAGLSSIFVDQFFCVYLFGLTIPEEPLTTIFSEKLDTITSKVLFPIFCAIHGFQTNIKSLGKKGADSIEALILAGSIGKLVGTFLSAKIFGIPWRTALSLAIILSCKGFLDIILGCIFRERNFLTVQEYTTLVYHILISSGVLLPLVRKLYKPSEKYSTVFRQNVMASYESGCLQTLVCIYKEENVPMILHFLEALNPTRANPIPVVTLQLIQLTGRVALPVMAPYYQLKTYSALRSHMPRCTRIVNAFTNFEKKLKSCTRLQHFISVATYPTMHNDICNLAYEKGISLLILPFHVQWAIDGSIEHSSLSIREVNNMVLEKAPSSVGILIDRGDQELIDLLDSGKIYGITIFYIGGPDDEEALAYIGFFAGHPCIRLTIIWLNSKSSKKRGSGDYEVLQKCLRGKEKRVNFQEVICNDGSETTKVVQSMNIETDLAVVGKHHDPQSAPLFGLEGEWNDYPELGTFGDFLVTSGFTFSVLVVQQEPHQSLEVEAEDKLGFADNLKTG